MVPTKLKSGGTRPPRPPPIYARDILRSRTRRQLATLNNNRGPFSSVYISCQTRDGDIGDFAPMNTRLVKHVSAPVADATILDSAAVVNLLHPGSSIISQEYGERMFVPYISAVLEQSSHTNLFCYVYLYLPVRKRQPDGREGKAPRQRWLLLP